MGNILSFVKGGYTRTYHYDIPDKPNQLTSFDNGVKNFNFDYYSNGAVRRVT